MRHGGVELCDLSKQQGDIARWKHMLQKNVSSVSDVSSGCCKCFLWILQNNKSRSGCCICCNGCTRMLQAFVPNVSVVFPDVYCKCVYLNVARVSHIYCMCFYLDVAYILQWLLQSFLGVFYKCFRRMLQHYNMTPLFVTQICVAKSLYMRW
jgi:hypothetical protein